jgi:LmbE family N-acetylglucosaminyl deacetylase
MRFINAFAGKPTPMRILFFILTLLQVSSCSQSPINYEAYKNAQDYNVTLWKNDGQLKHVALFIFPHPDDEIVCAGTIATLKQQGWKVNLITLTQGVPGEKEIRNKEWKNAMKKLSIDKGQIIDLPNNTWNDVMNDKLLFWNENKDSIRQIISEAIEEYSPSLLFTYDDILGGYGHPEHKMTAEITKDIFLQKSNDTSFTPQFIYQITLPEKLELLYNSKLESYNKFVSANGGKNLPEPTIAFDITQQWPIKKEAASQYPSQAKTLKKFFLWPTSDTTGHYSSFDREYYYVIKR